MDIRKPMTTNRNIEQLLEDSWDWRRVGQYEKARQLLMKAQELCKGDDYRYLGRIFHIYAQFESDHDNPMKALLMYERSLGYYKRSGNSNTIAHSTRHIADLQRSIGNDEDSERNYRRSIDMYRANKSTKKGDLANALRGFGILLEKRGRIQEAIEIWKETKELYKACNLQEGVDEAISKLDSLT